MLCLSRSSLIPVRYTEIILHNREHPYGYDEVISLFVWYSPQYVTHYVYCC